MTDIRGPRGPTGPTGPMGPTGREGRSSLTTEDTLRIHVLIDFVDYAIDTNEDVRNLFEAFMAQQKILGKV